MSLAQHEVLGFARNIRKTSPVGTIEASVVPTGLRGVLGDLSQHSVLGYILLPLRGTFAKYDRKQARRYCHGPIAVWQAGSLRYKSLCAVVLEITVAWTLGFS